MLFLSLIQTEALHLRATTHIVSNFMCESAIEKSADSGQQSFCLVPNLHSDATGGDNQFKRPFGITGVDYPPGVRRTGATSCLGVSFFVRQDFDKIFSG